jgi:hypothetical protein
MSGCQDLLSGSLTRKNLNNRRTIHGDCFAEAVLIAGDRRVSTLTEWTRLECRLTVTSFYVQQIFQISTSVFLD